MTMWYKKLYTGEPMRNNCGSPYWKSDSALKRMMSYTGVICCLSKIISKNAFLSVWVLLKKRIFMEKSLATSIAPHPNAEVTLGAKQLVGLWRPYLVCSFYNEYPGSNKTRLFNCK